MKKINFFKVLVIGIFVLNTCCLQAQRVSYMPLDSINSSHCIFPIHKSCVGEITSYEHPTLAASFPIGIKCYFLDTTTIDSVVWELPNGWSVVSLNPVPLIGTFGDSLLLSFILSIPDTVNLPFYPQRIGIKLLTNRQDSDFQTITMAGKVYFTPYNSIEIWSLREFYDLKRYWLEEDSIAPPRIYIPRDSIPQSNLGDDPSIYERDSATWDNWWIDNFREIEIEGLAYTILMKPIPYDSLEYYEDLYDEENNTRGGNVQKGKKTFKGTITGKITAFIETDLGTTKKIGLAGLHVCLMRKIGAYYEWGEDYTKEDGSFSISYNKDKNTSSVDFYIEVKSETNSSYDIRSRSMWGVYDQRFSLGSYKENAGANDVGDKRITSDKADGFRATHWARKGMKYFRDNSAYIKGGLRIKLNDLAYMFSSYSNNYFTWGMDPAIHLESGDGAHENTIYHEFGHYTMYRLQNNNILIPYGVEGVNHHSWSKENTGLLAWIEGWADAVQMILDAAHWQEDGEYGIDEVTNYFENLKIKSNNGKKINNGFRSEYHIATAIYDLWDGSNKGLPLTIPELNIHGWDDSQTTIYNENESSNFYSWKSIDDVELTFAQICAPMQTIKKKADLEELSNIGDYYYKLLYPMYNDCNTIANVTRAFRENRVLWNIQDYEDELYIGNCTFDNNLFKIKSIAETGIFIDFLSKMTHVMTDDYWVNIPIRDGTGYSTYYLYGRNSSRAFTDDYWFGIYDASKNMYERFELYLNSQYNSSDPNPPYAKFHTCGWNQILVRNGKLELGGSNGTYSADLTINDKSLLRIDAHGELILNGNSILYIEAGGTLYIKSGATVILRDNASIIVKDGGYICVETGANINLGANTKITLLDGANIGLNPVLKISSVGCTSICDYGTIGDGTVSCGCVAQYTHETLTYKTSQSLSYKDYTIKNELRIKNGATVSFTNSTLRFYKNAKIVVEPGSKLILNNCTSTSVCEGSENLWQGIQVLGKYNFLQTDIFQGVVELNNTIIENAVCGVSVGNANSYGLSIRYGSGIVYANNTHFTNNKQAVYFAPYAPYSSIGKLLNNKSYFNNCVFEINKPLNTIGGQETMVELHGVSGIKFTNCKFLNNTSLTPSPFPSPLPSIPPIGIYANNASIRVGELSFSMPSNGCEFSRLYYGIWLNNSDASSIYASNFSDNHIGVIALGSKNLTVEKNQFNIPSQHFSFAVGAYLAESSLYRIENNNFASLSKLGTGIVAYNSGNANNFIKNNSFSGLCTGCQAIGYNGNGYTDGNSQGLVYQCNVFEDNGIDISIASTANIRYIQSGSPIVSATGNATLNSNLNIRNDGVYFEYQHLPISSHTPFLSVIETFKPVQKGTDCCILHGYVGNDYYGDYYNSTYCYLPLPKDMSELQSIYGIAKDIYDTKMIVTRSSGESENSRGNDCTDFSINWEDDEAIAIVAQLEILSTTDPFTVTIDGREPITCLEKQIVLYYELSNLKQYMDMICYTALEILANDTTGLDINKYRLWISRFNTIESDYALADSYINSGEFAQAGFVLNAMSSKFEGLNVKTHQNYLDYLAVRQEYAALPEGDDMPAYLIDELVRLSSYDDIVSIKAYSFGEMLFSDWRETYPRSFEIHPSCICSSNGGGDEPITRGKGKGKSHKSMEEDEQTQNLLSEKKQEITVKPNPTTGKLQVTSYELQVNNIEIYNVVGQKAPFNSPEGGKYSPPWKLSGAEVSEGLGEATITIDVSHLANGMYFLKIQTESGIVMKKFVKN